MEALASAERACEEKLRSLTQAKVRVPHAQTPLLVKIRSAATVWFSKPHKTHKPRAEQPWPRSLRDPCQGVPQRSMPGGPSEIRARGPSEIRASGPLGDRAGGPSEICARGPRGQRTVCPVRLHRPPYPPPPSPSFLLKVKRGTYPLVLFLTWAFCH